MTDRTAVTYYGAPEMITVRYTVQQGDEYPGPLAQLPKTECISSGFDTEIPTLPGRQLGRLHNYFEIM